jgi:hypothetical protein
MRNFVAESNLRGQIAGAKGVKRNRARGIGLIVRPGYKFLCFLCMRAYI